MNEKTVSVNIPLEKTVHTAAKMAAIKAGKTLKAWLASVIKDASVTH